MFGIVSRSSILTILIVALFSGALTDRVEAQVREIARPGLGDIAMAGYDQFGPVIYYDPAVVAQAGPVLSEFFRAHEYGHHALNHITRQMWEANPFTYTWVRQMHELEADAWAARTLASRGNTASVNAAYQLFYSQGNHRASLNHPTGFQRAAAIQQAIGAGVP